MAVKRENPPKAPSQNPVDFYKSKQQGGAHGSPANVPERIKGGPSREKMSRKGL